MKKILIIEDNAIFRNNLKLMLEDTYTVFATERMAPSLKILQENYINLVILDLILPGVQELELLEEIKKLHPNLDVVVLSNLDKSTIGARAVKLGAKEFLLKEEFSKSPELVINTISNILNFQETAQINEAYLAEKKAELAEILIPDHPVFQEVYEKAVKAASGGLNILITGSTGSGKEILTKYIKQMVRPTKPMITVNCGAICASLSESELFGHEKSSFTGAEASRQGKLELANEGILFLDELGNMPPNIQEKILRVIEDKKVIRVGASKEIDVDFLLISATNTNLKEAIAKGAFRQDLYYRVNQFKIKLPEINDYPEVIPQFVKFFVNELNIKYNTNYQLSEAEWRYYQNMKWLGGIRELKNTIQTNIVMNNFPKEKEILTAFKKDSNLNKLGIAEKQAIIEALSKNNNNITSAAKYLGIPRQTLQSKIKKYKAS
ncbi:sigma-54-dependent transcriptional regulator [Candidatus Margulisiibacteriota bacterium]